MSYCISRSKAVANGAVCFYLEQFVSVRVTKITYGTEIVVDYDANDPEHIPRLGDIFVRPSGRVMIRHGFSAILKKVRYLTRYE